MEITSKLRGTLESMGLKPGASDDEARAFIAEQGIRVIDETSGVAPDRLADLYATASRFGAVDEVRDMVKSGKSEAEILDAILQKHAHAEPVRGATEIGLSGKEKRQYSFRRAILAQLNRDRNLAPFEFEVSDATAKHMQQASRGFMVPLDILTSNIAESRREAEAARDMIAGSGGTGKYTIQTDLLMGEFIELLRNATVLSRMGIRWLTGLRGNIAIPRLTAGCSYYWVAEQASVTKSTPVFDQVTLTPKQLAAKTIYSRLFLQQSSLGVEAFVRAEIALAMAQGIEYGALYGTGNDAQPKGLFNADGVTSIALGTNGAAITYADLVDMETKVADGNVLEDGTMAYLTNPRVRGKLKKTQVFSGTNGMPVWTRGMAPGEGEVNGYRALCTGLIKKNGTKGTGTNLSSAAYGKWSDLIVALWGSMDFMVDPYSGSDTGDTKVVAFQSLDTALRHTASFCKVTDIDTGDDDESSSSSSSSSL